MGVKERPSLRYLIIFFFFLTFFLSTTAYHINTCDTLNNPSFRLNSKAFFMLKALHRKKEKVCHETFVNSQMSLIGFSILCDVCKCISISSVRGFCSCKYFSQNQSFSLKKSINVSDKAYKLIQKLKE